MAETATDNEDELEGGPFLRKVLRGILRPLAKTLLTHGVPVQDAYEELKRAYVTSAEKDFLLPGKKMSVARLSILTGLNRIEVARLRKQDTEALTSDPSSHFHNRAAAVVAGWVSDEAFLDEHAKPADLPMEGDEKSFSSLVKQYSRGLGETTYAVLDELIRVGTVERLASGSLRLLNDCYCPHKSKKEQLVLMGEHVSALLNTIDFNLTHEKSQRKFQRAVRYHNISPTAAEVFKRKAWDESQALLLSWNKWLKDSNNLQLDDGVQGTDGVHESSAADEVKHYVGVGIYHFDEGQEK